MVTVLPGVRTLRLFISPDEAVTIEQGKCSQHIRLVIAFTTTEIYYLALNRWASSLNDIKKAGSGFPQYFSEQILKTFRNREMKLHFSVLLCLIKEKEVFMKSTDITWTPSVTF